MFDNPKKELERLEQRLLAAQADEEEILTGSFDEEDAEFEENIAYDDGAEERRAFSRRSVGFDEPEYSYTMDTDRYVAAPRKKGIGKFLRSCLLLALAIALFAWWKGWLL